MPEGPIYLPIRSDNEPIVGPPGPPGNQGPEGPSGPQGDPGAAINYNAVGNFADRSTYNAQPAGFAFLSLNGNGSTITEPVLYVRTGASGNWSNPVYFQPFLYAKNVDRDLGVIRDAYSEAENNWSRIQGFLNIPGQQIPLFIPGSGQNNGRPIYISRTLRLKYSGREVKGISGAQHGYSGAQGKYASILLMRASNLQSDGYGTLFDGVNKRASTVDGLTITLVGRTVTEEDRFNSFEITGGGNANGQFIAGWYVILEVNVASNTWTLDRVCTTTTGSLVDGMQGFYVPAFIRDESVSSRIEGICFTGTRVENQSNPSLSDARHAVVGLHIAPSEMTEEYLTSPPDNRRYPSTGSGYVTNCGFNNVRFPIVMGGGFAKYGDTTATDWYLRTGPVHADNMVFTNIFARNCENLVTVRSRQAVGHSFRKLWVGLYGSCFHFDAAGKIHASHIELSGVFPGKPQRCLYLGAGVNRAHSPFLIEALSTDGGTATRNPQLVVTNRTALSHDLVEVTFNSGMINRAPTHDNFKLIDINANTHVSVRDMSFYDGSTGWLGIWENSIRLRNGTYKIGNQYWTFSPSVTLENIYCTTNHPWKLLDVANSEPGGRLTLKNCRHASAYYGVNVTHRLYYTFVDCHVIVGAPGTYAIDTFWNGNSNEVRYEYRNTYFVYSSGSTINVGLWSNSIKLKSPSTSRPVILLDNVPLGVTNASQVGTLVDGPNSDSGSKIFFRDCELGFGTGNYYTGTYTVP